MKVFFIAAFLGSVFSAHSQWTRVEQLPDTDISSLYHNGNVFYAGGKNVIYVSQNNGLTWDSTSPIPELFLIKSIIIYKNDLYATAPHRNIFKSRDGGAHWQVTSLQGLQPGTFPDVADFCEFRGDLYAATLGNSVYKLDPLNGDIWMPFSTGLSNISVNLPVIASNSNAMIAGTNDNGIYDHLSANSTTWEERLLTGQIDVNEGAYDIVTAHDTLFYAGTTGKFYMSTDDGLSWGFIGDRLPSAATSLVNAKQALIMSRHLFDGSLKTVFYYIKKDALLNPFVNFSVVSDDHFTYDLNIVGNRLWDASNRGLFFMSLSDLPGITANDDVTPIILPVRFTALKAKCKDGEEIITWKTDDEQNGGNFDIERSMDRMHWISIGSAPSNGNSSIEHSYVFTDNHSVQNSYYRIAQNDGGGKTRYSAIIKSSCSPVESFTSWPNPFLEVVNVNIYSDTPANVSIQMIDSRGAVVKLHRATIVQGSNLLSVDTKSLPAGFYYLSASWGNGQMQVATKVVKL